MSTPQRRTKNNKKSQAWIRDGNLQLQQIAYQARGEGTWEGESSLVPVTRAGELLTDLSGNPKGGSGLLSSRKNESLSQNPRDLERAPPETDASRSHLKTGVVTITENPSSDTSVVIQESPLPTTQVIGQETESPHSTGRNEQPPNHFSAAMRDGTTLDSTHPPLQPHHRVIEREEGTSQPPTKPQRPSEQSTPITSASNV